MEQQGSPVPHGAFGGVTAQSHETEKQQRQRRSAEAPFLPRRLGRVGQQAQRSKGQGTQSRHGDQTEMRQRGEPGQQRPAQRPDKSAETVQGVQGRQARPARRALHQDGLGAHGRLRGAVEQAQHVKSQGQTPQILGQSHQRKGKQLGQPAENKHRAAADAGLGPARPGKSRQGAQPQAEQGGPQLRLVQPHFAFDSRDARHDRTIGHAAGGEKIGAGPMGRCGMGGAETNHRNLRRVAHK